MRSDLSLWLVSFFLFLVFLGRYVVGTMNFAVEADAFSYYTFYRVARSEPLRTNKPVSL